MEYLEIKSVNKEVTYLVQLTLGISKCSVKLSRCRLNSSTRCLCVLDAFCFIRSFCCKTNNAKSFLSFSFKILSQLSIIIKSYCFLFHLLECYFCFSSLDFCRSCSFFFNNFCYFHQLLDLLVFLLFSGNQVENIMP